MEGRTGADVAHLIFPATAACRSRAKEEDRPDAAALQRELATVYDESAPVLSRWAKTITSCDNAADAVQETFFRYWAYRREGGVVENARAWLFRVLRNVLIDTAQVTSRQVFDTRPRSVDPRAKMERDLDVASMMRRLPDLLSERELESFRLRAAGLSYQEIAYVLDVETGTVASLLARAVAKLRKSAQRTP